MHSFWSSLHQLSLVGARSAHQPPVAHTACPCRQPCRSCLPTCQPTTSTWTSLGPTSSLRPPSRPWHATATARRAWQRPASAYWACCDRQWRRGGRVAALGLVWRGRAWRSRGQSWGSAPGWPELSRSGCGGSSLQTIWRVQAFLKTTCVMAAVSVLDHRWGAPAAALLQPAGASSGGRGWSSRPAWAA